jgi:hypothetical protein
MAIGLRNVASAGSTAAVTTIAQTVPAGVVNGDFLLWVIAQGTATNPATDPAGWTRLRFATTTNDSLDAWYRIASSEPASYNSPTLTSAQTVTAMAAYSGVDTVTPLDVAIPAATAGTTAVTFNAITPVTPGAWVLGLAALGYASSTTVPGASDATSTNLSIDVQNRNTTSTNVIHVIDAIGHAAWSSGAFTPNMSAPATLARTIGQSVALRPAMYRRDIIVVQQAVNRSVNF